MADRFQVGLLGPTTIDRDGAAVPVAGAPQRTVLALLALSAPRTVSDTALVDALWPGAPPDNATGNLQSYVSRLRRQLGADALRREPLGYRLDVEPDGVDVVRFADLVARAQVETEPADAAARFVEALALWRGEPFADVTDPMVFAPDRARLAALHRRAVEGWLTARCAAGEDADVLPDLERAVAEDRSDEALHLLLMRVLHRLRRTPEALRVGADLRQRMIDETGLEPSAAVGDLERRILADDPDLRAEAATSHLDPVAAPGRLAPPDRFVGRADELAVIARAIREHRVVTITGPGGAGKTRLVKELVDRRAIGTAVVLVELASALAPEVPGRLAGALGVPATNADLEGALIAAVAARPVTLVLDNCEHVREAARSLIERLIAAGGDVVVLTTSRVRLGAKGEKVVRLGPLDADDQIELFCDRAALVRGDFDLSPEARTLVRSIGRRLDGLPLGLELAAGREAVFGLAQLEAQLSIALDVVEPVDGDDRRSITSAVEWSYGLLTPDAQRLFDRLIEAPGGVTLDGLAHLWPDGLASASPLLSELVEASLVDAELAADPPRYRALEVVRRVGGAHLDPAARTEAVAGLRRWMQHHVDEVVQLQHDRSPLSTVLLRREIDNLAAALVLDGDRDALARLGVLTALVVADHPRPELVERLRGLDGLAGADDEAALLGGLAAGIATWLTGDIAEARPLIARARDGLPGDHPLHWATSQFEMACAVYAGEVAGVEAATEEILGDPWAPPFARATCVSCAALINLFAGRPDEAGEWMAREHALIEQVSSVDGFVAYTHGELLAPTDPEAAVGWFRRARMLSDVQGQQFNAAISIVGLAGVLVRADDTEGAATACADAIRTTTRLGLWPQAWTAMRITAELLVDLAEPALAGVVLSAGDADPRATEVQAPELVRHDALWARIDEALGADGSAAMRATGRAMTGPAVADAVLAVLDHRRGAPEPR